MALQTKSNVGEDDWRLEKYTNALQDMLSELKSGPNQPDRDLLIEYGRRLDLLKGVLQTSKLPSIEEKVVASQLIQPGLSDADGLDVGKSMEIKQRHRSKYSEDQRRELFGTSSPSKESSKVEGGSQDLDELVKYEHQRQEKIAEHMLVLTRSLKEQVSLAGKIVKNDTEVLEKSSKQIDVNQDKLKVESEKLETFTKRACKCWVWFMLALVCSTFIGMVLFMRLFRKRLEVLAVTPEESPTP
jgi:SNARE protein 1